jgi:NDP-sugar pyrophosphorylase family protein
VKRAAARPPRSGDVRVAVVLAGGLGTRVAHLTSDDRPKALLPVDGRPFIDLKLAQLSAAGVNRAILLLGRGADAIRAHVGDGSDVGLEVSYRDDGNQLLGTGGAIRAAFTELPDTFWVTNGDTLIDAPLAAVERQLLDRLVGVMTVLENGDLGEPSNVDVADGLVTQYERGTPTGSLAWIDCGLLLFHREAFASPQSEGAFDLGVVLRDAAQRRRLAAFAVSERFHDIGTEAAWRETDDGVRSTRFWDRLGLRPRTGA